MRKNIKRYKIKSIKLTKEDYKNLKKSNNKEFKKYYIEKYLEKEAPVNTREINIYKLSEYFSLEYEEAKNIYEKWKKEFMKAKVVKE